jgi:flagellar biosynthesis component FlhA
MVVMAGDVSSEDKSNKAISSQTAALPGVLGVSGIILGVLGIVPGVLGVAGATGIIHVAGVPGAL